MLKDVKTGRYYIKPSELNLTRKRAAKNGFVIGEINNPQDDYAATIKGMPPEFMQDMFEFLETGSSPFSRATSFQEIEEISGIDDLKSYLAHY